MQESSCARTSESASRYGMLLAWPPSIVFFNFDAVSQTWESSKYILGWNAPSHSSELWNAAGSRYRKVTRVEAPLSCHSRYAHPAGTNVSLCARLRSVDEGRPSIHVSPFRRVPSLYNASKCRGP